jgi:hypothetical protein
MFIEPLRSDSALRQEGHVNVPKPLLLHSHLITSGDDYWIDRCWLGGAFSC